MRWWKACSAPVAVVVLLAGCVSTPAPVINHSFGGTHPPSSAGVVVVPSTAATAKGARTFGLGGHANGTLTAKGYVVASGDTLYSIAFANGLDFRQLAAWNGVPPPYVIHPGQVLKLHPPVPALAGSHPIAAARPESAPASSAPVFGPVTHQSVGANGAGSAASLSTRVPVAGETGSPTSAARGQSQPAPTPPPPAATRTVAGVTWRWPAPGKLISGFEAGGRGDGAGIDIGGKSGTPIRAAASGTVVYSGNGLIGYGELVIVKHNDTYLSAYGHNRKRLVTEGQHVDAGQEIALMGASGAPRVELLFEIRKNGKPVDPMDYLPKR